MCVLLLLPGRVQAGQALPDDGRRTVGMRLVVELAAGWSPPMPPRCPLHTPALPAAAAPYSARRVHGGGDCRHGCRAGAPAGHC